jgi:uncharacterized membrane protein (DUF106 family)
LAEDIQSAFKEVVKESDYQKNNKSIPQKERLYEISRMLVEFQLRPMFFMVFIFVGLLFGLIIGGIIGVLLGAWLL